MGYEFLILISIWNTLDYDVELTHNDVIIEFSQSLRSTVSLSLLNVHWDLNDIRLKKDFILDFMHWWLIFMIV
jgi:hypothetical protein